MHKILLVVVVVSLLCACNKPAPPTPAATSPAPPAPAAVAPSDPAPVAETGGDALIDKAIDDVLGDHEQYRSVIDAFQKAVVAKDAAAVAALVDYPFKASIDGKKKTIADAQAFVAQYDEILTPPIARVIGEQQYRNLFVNEKGVMFGRGEAWINGICKNAATCKTVDVRVVAIQPTNL